MPRVSATSWSCVAPMYLRQSSPADENQRKVATQGVVCLFLSNPPHTNSSVGSSSVVKMLWGCVQGSDAATHMSAVLAWSRRAGC